MILNYLLILAYANQKFLRGTRTKKSPSYLQTGNRLCHLNVLQGMSHLNASPQVNFPSTSSSNIWGILFVFSEAISQGSDQMAQWNLHIRKNPGSRHSPTGAAQGTARWHRAVVTAAQCLHQAVLSGVMGVWLVLCHTGCQSQPEQAAGEVQREKALIHHKPWLYRKRDHRGFALFLSLTQHGAGADLAARSSKA